MNWLSKGILSTFMTFSAISHVHSSETVMHYESEVKGEKTQKEWIIDQSGNLINIKGQTPMTQIQIECSKDYSFIKYIESSKNNEKKLSLYRNKDQLMVDETNNGKTTTKSFTVESKPWIQEFAFGLIPFVKGNDNHLTFVIVNPKDLTLNTLVAKKSCKETLTIKGNSYEAQKIILTLPGLKGKFWKAAAWFDTKTYTYLKYEGNEGPGTPTKVTLFNPS